VLFSKRGEILPKVQSINRFENSRSRLFREHRTAQERRAQFLKNYAWIILLCLLLIALLMPALTVVLAVLFLIVCLLSLPLKKEANWLLREPIHEKNEKEMCQLKSSERENAGILYLGNAVDYENKALWFSQADLVTHGLILGTTGSGKTQLLLGMMHQFAAIGSGFIFCDGKGDVKTWFYLYSIAKQLGLEDNIMVINFLTAGQTKIGKSAKFSNTLNPFSCGSSDALMEIISGFMGGSGNDSSMWRGRAEALGRCLLRALCELRDNGEIDLSIDVIRSQLPLNKLEKLAHHPGLSDFAKEGIEYYLGELPAWNAYKEASEQDTNEGENAKNDAKKTAYEQHGYLTMQFTKTLEMLSGTYAHITRTDLAEVDFKDIITNRRILYIMLPSLEKSPESLKDLGRMIVTSIRNALAGLLGGDQLTGDKQFLLDAKPTHADSPFGIFLDEYGSYAVDGFGDIGAQARSLNISVWFAGQEFDSFKKGSDIEASRILSNTGIKIFMKTESDTTTQIANERAGETYVYAANHVKLNDSGFSDKTVVTGSYSAQKVKRITKEDLVSQKPGECHVFFGESLWRVKAFYGDFTLPQRTHVNHFIKIKSKQDSEEWSPMAADLWVKEAKGATHPDNMSASLIRYLNEEERFIETI
jgi:hypothetical protein